MPRHILQSPLWAQFKTLYGTPGILAGNVMYTVHKIPFTSYSYAYAPRVDPFQIDYDVLKKSLKEHNCIALHFDVPNVYEGTLEAPQAKEIFSQNCVISPREEFAKGNYILDLTPSEEALLVNMHTKHRYNISYASKHGVEVTLDDTQNGFDKFYELYDSTGKRQHFYARSKTYLQKLWDLFQPANVAHIMIASYQGKPLAAWMLFVYENVLYYPYGGSSVENKNLFASTILAWEAIKFGKSQNCHLFDMWGASKDPTDTTDPYYGFSVFKAKFGAKHVTYIDSYDLVINSGIYQLFNLANTVRWKVLNSLR